MSTRAHVSLLALATATLLAACASNPPMNSDVKTPVASNSATAEAAPKQDTVERGWRKITRDGEDVYCQRQTVTGSRAKVVEKCLTLEQLTALRENSQDLLRRSQSGGRDMPGPANPGAPTSAVNPP